MTLESGRVLGHYQIVSSLGAGGMGMVYRARDTRLGREVAIKLLLDAVAHDPERLARFEREARVLASLNHPHIATLHGFESDHDTRFLVMELVEGETLADRIARGPLAVDDTISLFSQIAQALEAAHEKGVVHRDLKPANVKMANDGRAKVLDFGLAKAIAPMEMAAGGNPALSESPTMTLAATMRGEIMGTAAYMSPEQAAGKLVDKRSDVWAFGACLFEALTGRRAFDGEDAANTLAAVLRDPIDLDALPATCPPRLRNLIERCLVRDARNRLRDIGDARIELQAMGSRPSSGEPVVERADGLVSRKRRIWVAAAGGVVLGAIVALVASAVVTRARSASGDASDGGSVIRSTIDLDGVYPEPDMIDGPVMISPDGSLLTIGSGTVGSRLYARRLDSLDLRLIEGTDGAWSQISFSPDGQWFVHGNNKHLGVWKTPRQGGPSIRLADSVDYWGGDWDGNEALVFVADNGSGVSRVSTTGGVPEVLTKVDGAAQEVSHRFPVVLPEGAGILYSVKLEPSIGDWRVVAWSRKTGRTITLAEGGFYARYAPSGHLVYASGGALYAAPMELDPIRLSGSAVRVLEGVAMAERRGTASYSFSRDGKLVYAPPSSKAAFETTLSWVDRNGGRLAVSPDRRNLTEPRLSPDGGRIAATVVDGDGSDIYVYDLERGVPTRLTTSRDCTTPVWTADGERVVFISNRAGDYDLYWVRSDGGGSTEALTDDVNFESPSSVAPDGTLAFAKTGDIWTLRLGAGEPARPLQQTPENETNAIFSPDGRWIAYQLLQGNRQEIFVEAYPAAGRRVKVSINGGRSPVWSRSTRELFYLEKNERMMVVAYEVVGGEIRPGAPRLLFTGGTRETGMSDHLFDVSPDAGRFVMPDPADLSKAKVVLVQNWFTELERLAPHPD